MGRHRPKLPANRNCYGLSRVSWALAQISCFKIVRQRTEMMHPQFYCARVGRFESCVVIKRAIGEWHQRLHACVRGGRGHFEHMMW